MISSIFVRLYPDVISLIFILFGEEFTLELYLLDLVVQKVHFLF